MARSSVDKDKEYARQYYIKNKERIRQKHGEYSRTHAKAFYYANREKILAKSRLYNLAKTPEDKARQRAYDKARKTAELMLTYGIDEAELDRIEQTTVCDICRLPFPSQRQKHIDHNHNTGAYRGVLCRRCNVGIGAFKDSPEIMLAASKYLRGSA